MVRKASCRWLVRASLFGLALHASAQEVPAHQLAALASEDFKLRESGQAALLDWARDHQDVALEAVWREYRSSPNPEVRQRCLSVLRDLVRDRYLTEGPGFLGVGMSYGSVVLPEEISPVHAVLITTVRRGTPASRAGIQQGDMIVRLDGKGWVDESSTNEFSEQIAGRTPGTVVKLGIIRDGKWVQAEAVLVRQPPNLQLLRFGIPQVDEAAEERAAIDGYFKEWLNEKILQK